MIKVQKKNVQYTIDEKDLQEYKIRGFEVLTIPETPEVPEVPEVPSEPTKAELKAKADELGIAYPSRVTNAELTELINAATGE